MIVFDEIKTYRYESRNALGYQRNHKQLKIKKAAKSLLFRVEVLMLT